MLPICRLLHFSSPQAKHMHAGWEFCSLCALGGEGREETFANFFISTTMVTFFFVD